MNAYCKRIVDYKKLLTKSEEDLCCTLVNYLKDCGYEVYQEVALISGRVDVVAVKDCKQWAIEVKKQIGLPVLSQAYNWIDNFHYISVATTSMPNVKTGYFLRNTGIGMLKVCEDSIKIILSARLKENAKGVLLFEEQKNNRGGQKIFTGWTLDQNQRKDIKSTFITKRISHYDFENCFKPKFMDKQLKNDFPHGIISE